ncbi:MAG: HAD-IIB family hydrolase [Proteobacteria bacterium]|nr:HAD-IIB family hydrolase [Pseudomonadota bacterium]
MLPLREFTEDARRNIKAVLCDIDDTLTTDGHLTAEAYVALEALQDAGLLVFPITGRPAGWCDHIARMWPVDGVVGENGAFYFRYDHDTRTFTKRFLASDAERADNRRRLDVLKGEILKAVPGTAVASDQHYREADLAIDFCEDVAPLPADDIQRIVGIFEAAGATAKVSSIHVNGWFGDYDKLSMTGRMLDECFGIDMEADKETLVFVGDSPNDVPMFDFFPHAVGVANIADVEISLAAEPAYVTEAPGGAGFAELARALIAAKG